jgi:hypothetical protein
MKAQLVWTVAGLLIAGTSLTLTAHHSFEAEFSRDLPVEITGRVTRVEWMNPHARFYVDEVQEDGTVVNWNFELSSPNVLMRRGWRRDSLQEGDTVTVTGSRAKSAPHVANASRVEAAGGDRLFSGTSPEQ